MKILQGDKDATSTASQFYLDTISLEKQANGNYYAYLTSNTPVNLGNKPISSEDTQHQVVEMGTTEKNGHNQTVYRLTLTANELANGQPIKTKVHVKLDAMDYDHKYDIRLAIQGFKPETATSASANTSSSSSSVSSASSESSSVSSSSVSSSSSIADSSTTTSVAPSSSSQPSSSSSQSSNNDTSASSVVTDDKTKSIDTKSFVVNQKAKSDSSTGSKVNTTAKQSNLKTGNYKIAVSPDSQMDRFFAKEFNVKVGESTSVVSVTYQVPGMMGAIPSVTFNGQTKSIINNSITTDFTIPTKDLTPNKDGKVTLKSFTSVPMSTEHGYHSNITLNMNPALAGTTSDNNNSSSSSSESNATSDKDILQDGTYSINYNVYKSGTTTDSVMKTYMKSPAKIAVKDGKATITFATKNGAMSMMKKFSVNGTTAKAEGNNWVVTVPVAALSKTMQSNMTIYVAQYDFTEHPSADIVFDMSSVKKTGDNGSGSASSSSSSQASSSSASHSSSASSSSKASSSSASFSSQKDSKADITKDGKYSINYAIYKSGTKTDSTMKTYMKSPANITVKSGKATITFATKNNAMSMMKAFSVNGVTAKASGNNWTVTVPVSALSNKLKASMTIYVSELNFTEKPNADIVFDMNSIKKGATDNGDGTNDSSHTGSTANKINTGTALSTSPQALVPNATLHQLTILQGNSNSTSVAAQYFLPTIQLVKNNNGSYTGYVTTHTPTMMGSAPISFMDGTHQVKRVSNIKTGNYYQATYKFSLSAGEIKAPINTKIHVHFTEPLNYNHTYTIRLVIGRALNNASEATQPATGLPSMSGDTTTMPLNTSVSRGTFGPAATGTFENNDANTEQQADENTDKQASKKADSNKKATVKSGTNVAKNAKADQKDNSTQRNVLIIAGGIIAAALGYVGVSLLTNFFKKG